MVSLYPLHSICGALALVQRWWLWQQTSPSSPPPYSLWPMASPAQKDVWPREVMGPLGGEFGYKGGGGSSCSHRCSPSASSLLRTFTCAPIAPPPKYSFILMEGVGRWSEFFETSLLRDTVAILPALKWYRNSHAHKMLFHVPPSHHALSIPPLHSPPWQSHHPAHCCFTGPSSFPAQFKLLFEPFPECLSIYW